MPRNECHLLCLIGPGSTYGEELEEVSYSTCFHLAMKAAKLLKRCWKCLLPNGPGDLFEACIWSLTLLLTPFIGSSFPSGWASWCCVDSSFIHLVHRARSSPVAQTALSFQPLDWGVSSPLWIVKSAISLPWHILPPFFSLTWLLQTHQVLT